MRLRTITRRNPTTNDTSHFMTALPADHPDRRVVANEVHARPHDALEPPLRATHLAVVIAPGDRERELAHLAQLCSGYGVPPPGRHESHFSAQLADLRLKWERHTEFSSYTFLVPGLSPHPFSEPAGSLLPVGWVAGIPGRTVVAAHAKLVRASNAAPDLDFIAQYFEGNIPVGALIGDGTGSVFTDFRIQPDGHVRFLLQDFAFTPRQAGRMLQRVFEIESYRVMALLALPIARRLAPRLNEIEQALGLLTDAIAREAGSDETLLSELTKLAAEVENARNASEMRFSASRAYHDLVCTRIVELRERRVPGIQTIDAFMTRRLTPAIATCNSVSQRLRDLSERVAHASSLLSTRVEITRERQNQALLASMDRRARLQLRLQQTVEWLSVAAVTYYVAGLVGYVAKAFKSFGVRIDPDVAVGVAIPLVGILVGWAMHRVRHRLGGDASDPG